MNKKKSQTRGGGLLAHFHDWVDWLPSAEFCHHNSRSKATGRSPFEIVYGRFPVFSPTWEPRGSALAEDRAALLHKTMEEVLDIEAKMLQLAAS
jgi:hypothetical protein